VRQAEFKKLFLFQNSTGSPRTRQEAFITPEGELYLFSQGSKNKHIFRGREGIPIKILSDNQRWLFSSAPVLDISEARETLTRKGAR